jgi:hypothetical protein
MSLHLLGGDQTVPIAIQSSKRSAFTFELGHNAVTILISFTKHSPRLCHLLVGALTDGSLDFGQGYFAIAIRIRHIETRPRPGWFAKLVETDKAVTVPIHAVDHPLRSLNTFRFMALAMMTCHDRCRDCQRHGQQHTFGSPFHRLSPVQNQSAKWPLVTDTEMIEEPVASG